MLKTVKTRNPRPAAPRFEASMAELKRDAERGWEYFWRRREHLHRPGDFGDFTLKRPTAA